MRHAERGKYKINVIARPALVDIKNAGRGNPLS